jgi:hypothetical protein
LKAKSAGVLGGSTATSDKGIVNLPTFCLSLFEAANSCRASSMARVVLGRAGAPPKRLSESCPPGLKMGARNAAAAAEGLRAA